MHLPFLRLKCQHSDTLMMAITATISSVTTAIGIPMTSTLLSSVGHGVDA